MSKREQIVISLQYIRKGRYNPFKPLQGQIYIVFFNYISSITFKSDITDYFCYLFFYFIFDTNVNIDTKCKDGPFGGKQWMNSNNDLKWIDHVSGKPNIYIATFVF